jgi:hypothetical protein
MMELDLYVKAFFILVQTAQPLHQIIILSLFQDLTNWSPDFASFLVGVGGGCHGKISHTV